MLNSTQLDEAASRVDVLSAMRLAALDDGCNPVINPPMLADQPDDLNFNQVRSASTFAGYWQVPNSIELPNAFGNTFAYTERADIQENGARVNLAWSCEYPGYEGKFNLLQIQPSAIVSIEYVPQDEYSNLLLPAPEWVVPPTGQLIAREVMRPKPRLDFFCEAAANKQKVFAAYIADAARQACEFLKRFYRHFIVSSVAASKAGYSSLCIEAAARDHVVHLEMITLAKEHEGAPGSSAAGQIFTLGEGPWTRVKQSFSNLFLECSERVLCAGSIGVGLNAEAL